MIYNIEFGETYCYYDGPQIFGGTLNGLPFIALCIEEIDNVMWAVYACLSQENLKLVLADQIDLNSVFTELYIGPLYYGPWTEPRVIEMHGKINPKYIPEKGIFLFK